MPMYFPEWSNHDIEESTTATLAMCGEDFTTEVHFAFYAEVEAKWSVYSYNQYDPDDVPESPTLVDYGIESLTLYINGEEAYPGDTLYTLCNSWALDQIKYHDYEADDVELGGKEPNV